MHGVHENPEILIDADHWEDHVVAYVQGELSADQTAAFEGFMAGHDLCRLRVYELQQLFNALASIPEAGSSRDIVTALHEQIAAERTGKAPIARHSVWSQPVLRWAAGLALLLGAALLIHKLSSPQDIAQTPPVPAPQSTAVSQPSLEKGLAWLAGVQSSSGAWNAEGGDNLDPHHSVGLTGLALLAFTRDPATRQNGTYRDVLERGVGYLLDTQSADGRFGSAVGGSRFDHAIATLALIEVYQLERQSRLGRAAQAALRHVQGAPMDMSYQSQQIEQGNAVWAELVLLRASALGLEHPDAPYPAAAHALLQRALAGLTHGRSERVGGEAALLSRQETEGESAGSWQTFGPAGTIRGRVFSTSVAALLLQIPPPPSSMSRDDSV